VSAAQDAAEQQPLAKWVTRPDGGLELQTGHAVKDLAWHVRGDYFASVAPTGNTQVKRCVVLGVCVWGGVSPLFSSLLLLFVGGKSGNLACLIVDDCVSLSNGGFEVGSADMFPQKGCRVRGRPPCFHWLHSPPLLCRGVGAGVGWGWGWG
jgi:hypothetical protein